jgi:hypothetical protein
MGVLSGTGQAGPVTARLAPEPGYCCVRITDPEGSRASGSRQQAPPA